MNEVAGINARVRIYRASVHVQLFGRNDLAVAVNRLAKSVEDAAHQAFADAKLKRLAQKFNGRFVKVNAGGASENLNYASILVQVYYAAGFLFSVFVADINHFVVRNGFASADSHNRAFDRIYSSVFNSFHYNSTLR